VTNSTPGFFWGWLLVRLSQNPGQKTRRTHFSRCSFFTDDILTDFYNDTEGVLRRGGRVANGNDMSLRLHLTQLPDVRAPSMVTDRPMEIQVQVGMAVNNVRVVKRTEERCAERENADIRALQNQGDICAGVDFFIDPLGDTFVEQDQVPGAQGVTDTPPESPRSGTNDSDSSSDDDGDDNGTKNTRRRYNPPNSRKRREFVEVRPKKKKKKESETP
jgi:hypothetical protein